MVLVYIPKLYFALCSPALPDVLHLLNSKIDTHAAKCTLVCKICVKKIKANGYNDKIHRFHKALDYHMLNAYKSCPYISLFREKALRVVILKIGFTFGWIDN